MPRDLDEDAVAHGRIRQGNDRMRSSNAVDFRKGRAKVFVRQVLEHLAAQHDVKRAIPKGHAGHAPHHVRLEFLIHVQRDKVDLSCPQAVRDQAAPRSDLESASRHQGRDFVNLMPVIREAFLVLILLCSVMFRAYLSVQHLDLHAAVYSSPVGVPYQ